MFAVAGGDRAAFDRMTFRPRMMVLDARPRSERRLAGGTAFHPILIGPVAEQRRFHQDAELATVRGASEARAAVVVSSRLERADRRDRRREATTPLLVCVVRRRRRAPTIDGALAADYAR